MVREALIAGVLTALMILLFLGSWRSTLIVAISIPLSILTSLIILLAARRHDQRDDAGGLALAVGILVDDATVEIENIHRNLAMGKPLTQAILDGAQQIAVPAFVSTLAICIVFVSVVFSERPGAVSVHAAGAGGGVRDAGVVPAVAHAGADDGALSAARPKSHATRNSRRHEAGDVFWRLHGAFNRRFESLREDYRVDAGLGAAPSPDGLGRVRDRSCAARLFWCCP